MIGRLRLLHWLYLGRLTLVAGIFGGALLAWPRAMPETTRLATLVLLVSLAVTLASAWHTDVRGRAPGKNFLYAQVLFDAVLVTAIVHLTGGGSSDFAPLYILVIAAGALLLPLPGGVLIGALASILYFADIVWGHAVTLSGGVFVQIGVFAVMALATGYLGDRLRRTGTALGEVESELRQLRLDTGDILGTVETGVVTVDGAGRLVYLNRSASALLGIAESEWLHRPVLEELDRRVPAMGSIMRRTAETRLSVRRYETRVRDAAHRPPPVPERRVLSRERGAGMVLGITTTVLEREGAPWVTAVFQDITDGKRVEELNRRTERLQAVAELSASLAHEIKNPLASIRSAVEQLSRSRISREDRGILERLVGTESDRLSRLLSDFIEFSRVEIRRPAVVDLRGVAAAAIELTARHPAGVRGPRIEFQPPVQPMCVLGDEDLLHRAVFNLLLNAVQHAGPQGRVRLELSRPTPEELPSALALNSALCITVSDDGPGIAAEDVPRIFDPFFSRRKDGSGLGLALVHRAVEAHRGKILVDGGPGQGAQFVIYLPVHEGDGSG